MKFVETVKNIFKIEDLRKRILYTLGLILIYRLGCYVVIPGINPEALANLSARVESNGLLGLLDIFSGGAFSNASIFALGIMPYISASIVIQLLGIVVPYFQKMQKEGESGRRKINQWTRYLTIGVLLIQGPAYLTSLSMGQNALPSEAFILGSSNFLFQFTAVLVLLAGTMFMMWLGEKITDKGIGNGVSLIIMLGIVARLPKAFLAEVSTRLEVANGGLVMFIAELVVLYLIFMASIALVQAVRKIPVQYAKRIVGNKQYGGVRQYIPLKVNAAGVMPIIFAQALMFIPMIFARWEWAQGFVAAFAYNSLGYNVVYFILVVAFTYFYTAITVNPNMMADDMKRNGGFIPGVKPGKKTVEYIDTIMTRITLPGSIFLAVVAILPVFASKLGINQEFSYFFGGTSLLILVGVILDTLSQIESHLLSRHYDGLMKTGRIRGRGNI